jgi:hypothetical protein
MFDRIKKAFLKEPRMQGVAPEPGAASYAPLAEWAQAEGFEFSLMGRGFALDGTVAGKPCRIEVGKPSRKYVVGEELRGRVELGVDPDVMLLLMNRPLKDQLVRQAYAQFTDSLQTSVDSSLPEEVRVLAMYEELGWDSVPRVFWSRYSVVADDRGRAAAWLDDDIAGQLLEWPVPAPAAELPFMLMVLRGNAYLRMQHGPMHLPTLRHALQVFRAVSESARKAFPAQV